MGRIGRKTRGSSRALVAALLMSCGGSGAGNGTGTDTDGDTGTSGATTGGGSSESGAGPAGNEFATTFTGVDTGTDTENDPHAEQAGLFISRDQLIRARARVTAGDDPFAAQAQLLAGRADTALMAVADPFHMDDVSTIKLGWCDVGDAADDTLKEATDKLEEQSDWMRTLALQHALTDDTTYADKAVELMKAWADDHTLVNVYDFDPDFDAGTIAGMTDGSCTDRPWNFALDAMWQTYGLINAADAYLVLVRSGYPLGADGPRIRAWIRSLAAAVNSSFHAWTRWADAHPMSTSFARYRSDNHLSWALAGLAGAAAALEDGDVAAYVLGGGTWDDGRSGPYANPSPIRDVIDRAIEADTGMGNGGRIYEELILRDPPVGYAIFHLWAMTLVAQVAQTHFADDVYGFTGADGAGLELAFDRYAELVLGTRTSPMPAQEGDLGAQRWLWEIGHAQWTKTAYRDVVESDTRSQWIIQSIGPVTLLLGDDL